MKLRPYYHRTDRELAGTLLDLMEAQGLTEPPSIARAIEMIRQDLRQQHGDSVPALGTGRGIRVVDAWLPVIRAERAVIAAEQSGDTDALASARRAEAEAMHRAVTKSADQLAAERERSEMRRHMAKIRRPLNTTVVRDQVFHLMGEAALFARQNPDVPFSEIHEHIEQKLMPAYDRLASRIASPGKPGRKPKAIPVDQKASEPIEMIDLPVDQLTVHNDPRQVSLLVGQ